LLDRAVGLIARLVALGYRLVILGLLYLASFTLRFSVASRMDAILWTASMIVVPCCWIERVLVEAVERDTPKKSAVTRFSRAQALVPGRSRDFQCLAQSWDTSRCDRVAAILVFLYLLEGHPKGIAQITLTHSQFHALHPDHRTYFLINQTIAVARHGDVSLAAESESLLAIASSLWSARRIEALNGTCRRQLHTERAPEGAHKSRSYISGACF
jgi:hypothetical protein